MIPNLALIVAAYVNFRMIEVFLYSGTRYSSKGTRIAACVFAVLVFLVTCVSAIDIMATGSRTTLPR
jgi:hypothetical protein